MKIDAQIPTTEELTERLTLDECHPSLEVAKRAAGEAQVSLKAAKKDLTDQRAAIAGARATGTNADALSDLLTRQKALEMLVEDAEQDLSEARAAVEQEMAAAKRALAEAVDERLAQLQQVADEVAPHLVALRERFDALRSHVRRQDRTYDLAAGQGPRWPLSPIVLRFLRVPASEVGWVPPEKRDEAAAARRERARSLATGTDAGRRPSKPSGSSQAGDAAIRQGMAGLEAAERSGRMR